MAAWDRKDELERFERRFDAAEDVDALIEELGTPTRVAVELAKDYVPSPAPENEPTRRPRLLSRAEPEPEPEDGAAVRQRRELSPGGIAGFALFALFVGVPVGLVLICVGLPFLAAGLGVIAGVGVVAYQAIRTLNLVSDVLMIIGAGLVVIAGGLLLVWIGLWISISLCRLWIERVLVPMAGRLCVREE